MIKIPHPVTHVLIALIIASLIRDFFIKDKKKFPLYYILIAGLAGLIPDLDIVVYWILYYSGFSLNQIHRTFSHTLILPLGFLILAGLSYVIHKKGKRVLNRNFRFHLVFLMIALGTFIHLVLDALIAGFIMPFWPFSNQLIGLNLIDLLPIAFRDTFMPSLDALLLVLWLIYVVYRHKVYEFI